MNESVKHHTWVKIQDAKNTAKLLAESREKALVLTKLEEAELWLSKVI